MQRCRVAENSLDGADSEEMLGFYSPKREMQCCRCCFRPPQGCLYGVVLVLAATLFVGCGTTTKKTVTEQLLVSDAVDRAVQQLDFTHIRGEKVFLDVTYMKTIAPTPGMGWVNADYVQSSLRQHLLASHCLLQENKEDAEIIVEPRLGAMGADTHDVIYGFPQNNVLATAATLFPNSPPVPTLPELSIGKQSVQYGAAKLAVFAYHRETRDPVWQSGMLVGKSNSRDVWVMGAGPLQSGTIYASPRFAGERLATLLTLGQRREAPPKQSPVNYLAELHWSRPVPVIEESVTEERIAEVPAAEGETQTK